MKTRSNVIAIAVLAFFLAQCSKKEISHTQGSTIETGTKLSKFIEEIKQKTKEYVSNYKLASFKSLTIEDPHNSTNFKDFLGEIHNALLDSVKLVLGEIRDTNQTYVMVTKDCPTCEPGTQIAASKIQKVIAYGYNHLNVFFEENYNFKSSVLNYIPQITPDAFEASLDTAIAKYLMTSTGKELILEYENEVSSMDRELLVSYTKYFEEIINDADEDLVSDLDKEAIFSYAAIAKFSAYYWHTVEQSQDNYWHNSTHNPTFVYDGGYEGADRVGCFIAFKYCTNNPNNSLSGWGNGANHCCGLGAWMASTLSAMMLILITA